MGTTPSDDVADWTGQSVFTGTLTRKNGLTAVVRVDALLPPDDAEGDVTPEQRQEMIVPFGRFKIMAMDDGQPDPVQVANLLANLMDRPGRHRGVICHWGNRCCGLLTLNERGADRIATTFVMPPHIARQTLNFIKEASNAGSL